MLKLIRYYTPTVTLGELYLTKESEVPLYTIEPPWLYNEVNKSCIPEGTYLLERWDSHKHGNTYKIQGVHNRTGVIFHKGNTVEDTKGCILPNLSLDGLRGMDSGLAMDVLMNVLKQGRYTLEITHFRADYAKVLN